MSAGRLTRTLAKVRDWIAICLLLALTLAFFWKIALTNRILVGLDVFTYFYPYKAYAAAAIRHGNLPLWNPYLFMGVPFLANIQAATLYPLNLPLYWLSPPTMVSYAVVMHVFLGGAFTYLLSRRVLGFGSLGAFVAGVTFALGGFLGAQVEHVNQLSVLTWLPLMLLLYHLAFTGGGLLYPVLLGIVSGVQFLGGHAQSSYINVVALGCYALFLPLSHRLSGVRSGWRATVLAIGRGFGIFLSVILLAAGLAAFQLLPTYELSILSIRSAGLPYRQAVSFSLRPALLARSLLPGFTDIPFTEYVAYVGIIPLLLAFLGVWRRGRRQHGPFFAGLAALGLFLALGLYNPVYFVLYRLVPGISLFRVPARWLCLYALGMAILAGLGVEELVSLSARLSVSRRRIALGGLILVLTWISLIVLEPPSALVIMAWLALTALASVLLWFGLRHQRGMRYVALVASLAVAELFAASRYLPYDRATAPDAFWSMRGSVTFLLTQNGVHRFLSFSDGSFDPGDLREIQQIFGGQLSDEEVYEYLVATKQKEMITPNLPLLYRLQSIDGYDGGVLPLARYVEWQRLLLPEEDVSPDGRLQGRIAAIPEGRLLDLLNVKYVLTDKVYDVWVDGAYYDLAHRALVGGTGQSTLVMDDIPHFPTTALGVVSHVVGGADLEQRSPVAEITVTPWDGNPRSFVLRAGEDTAEGEYEAARPCHRAARIVGHWRDNPDGNDYHTLLEWEEAIYPREIAVLYLADQGELRLRGLTLLDSRTGAHQALTVSTEGRYRLVHSGDVKIYENLDVLPRAFVAHRARTILDDQAALAAIEDQSFEPQEEVILSSQGPIPPGDGHNGEDTVSILFYEPERVRIEADLASPGYLVLTDTYYPGWRATLDGRVVDILRADYYFRAVYLSEGEHVLEFVYDPASFKIGLLVTTISGLVVAGGLMWHRSRSWRSTS